MGEQKDMQSYAAELQRKVPVDVDDFKRGGFRADSYTTNPKYPNIFASAVVPVDRVYLTDGVTGKGGWYTKARLTANDPRPAGRNTMPTPFAWVHVEMLP